MLRMQRAARVLAPALLVSGCLGSSGGGGAAVRPASVGASASAVPMAASAYLALAASYDLYEIRSAQMALERSTDGANRALAQQLQADHSGTSAQLSMAGRRLNLLPSASLLPEQQAMLDALAATSDFDQTFRAQQVQVGRQAMKLHGDFAKNGSSPTLRPVAQNAEQVYRRNLARLGVGY